MLVSVSVVVDALYLAKGLLVPLTLAALLSFLLSPVCGWLERRTLSRTEIHWHLDEVDERHHNFILQGMNEIIQIHHESQQELQAEKPSEPASTTDSPNFVVL